MKLFINILIILLFSGFGLAAEPITIDKKELKFKNKTAYFKGKKFSGNAMTLCFGYHEYFYNQKGQKIRWDDNKKKFILYKITVIKDTPISEANEKEVCNNKIYYEKTSYKNGLQHGKFRL